MAQSRLPLLVARQSSRTFATFTLIGQLNRERSILEGDGGLLLLEADGFVGARSLVLLESLTSRRGLDGSGDIYVALLLPQGLVAARAGRVGGERLLVGGAIQTLPTRLPNWGVGRCRVRHTPCMRTPGPTLSNPSW